MSGSTEVLVLDEYVECGCEDTYFCPVSGAAECPRHGGFDVCCSYPELHIPLARHAGEHEMAIVLEGDDLFRTCSCGRVRDEIHPDDGEQLLKILHRRHLRAMALNGNRPSRIETLDVDGRYL